MNSVNAPIVQSTFYYAFKSMQPRVHAGRESFQHLLCYVEKLNLHSREHFPLLAEVSGKKVVLLKITEA